MKFEFKHIAVIVLGALFLVKRLMARHPLILKYNSYISAILILSLSAIIAIEFWKSNQMIGIFAVVLGLAAMVKVAVDLRKGS